MNYSDKEIYEFIFSDINPCPHCGRRKFIDFERQLQKPKGRYFCSKCRAKADWQYNENEKLTVEIIGRSKNCFIQLIKSCKKRWNEQLSKKQWAKVTIEDHCSNCEKWKEHIELLEEYKKIGFEKIKITPCRDCEWSEYNMKGNVG